MPVEGASYINQLNESNPTSSDLKSEGDNHIRLLKSTLKTTFPNVTGAVTPTHTEINRLVGVTGLVQDQINRTLRQSGGSTVNALPDASTRANKILSFDASGHPATTIATVDLTNAVTAASTATTQAGIATTQAGIATTQAGLATTNGAAQVALATAQAGISTTKAAEAAASAASIAGGPVASINSLTGVVVLAKGDIGLGNVDNTSDATKNSATATLTNKTLTNYTEPVFTVTGTTPALSPTNGSIQTWTLSGSSTPTYGTWAAGQSIILMITAGANSITWPTTSWSKVGGGGAAPTLTSSGATCVILWKVGSTVYGALLGSV